MNRIEKARQLGRNPPIPITDYDPVKQSKEWKKGKPYVFSWRLPNE